MTIKLSGATALVNAKRIKGVPNGCLMSVQRLYGNHPSIGPHAGQYPYAIDGWNFAAHKHPGKKPTVGGLPVYFGASQARTDRYAKAGDVAISDSTPGWCWGIDGTGRFIRETIDGRAKRLARPYLGYTDDFLGYMVTPATPVKKVIAKAKPKPKATMPTVKLGSTGEAVRRLQTLLNKHGARLKVDGIFGAKTLAAVRAFQKKVHITIDGIVGPQTWGKLG